MLPWRQTEHMQVMTLSLIVQWEHQWSVRSWDFGRSSRFRVFHVSFLCHSLLYPTGRFHCNIIVIGKGSAATHVSTGHHVHLYQINKQHKLAHAHTQSWTLQLTGPKEEAWIKNLWKWESYAHSDRHRHLQSYVKTKRVIASFTQLQNFDAKPIPVRRPVDTLGNVLFLENLGR